MFPCIDWPPTLTSAEMLEVDRIMIDELGIDLTRMMENAGRSLADLVIAVFQPESVLVLAGSGGNGGGAMTAARHLVNRGIAVRLASTRAMDELSKVTQQQALILERMGVPLEHEPMDADVVIDGVIGYSLVGPPRGLAKEFIEWCDTRTIVSLDIPSGLDATTGETPGKSVDAAATVTLALPKRGMVRRPSTGRVFLADISVPASTYRRFGLEVGNLFARSSIVELTA